LFPLLSLYVFFPRLCSTAVGVPSCASFFAPRVTWRGDSGVLRRETPLSLLAQVLTWPPALRLHPSRVLTTERRFDPSETGLFLGTLSPWSLPEFSRIVDGATAAFFGDQFFLLGRILPPHTAFILCFFKAFALLLSADRATWIRLRWAVLGALVPIWFSLRRAVEPSCQFLFSMQAVTLRALYSPTDVRGSEGPPSPHYFFYVRSPAFFWDGNCLCLGGFMGVIFPPCSPPFS